MRSHVFHRLFTPACARFRQWSLCLLIPGVLALTGGAPHANGSPIRLAPQDLQIELPADSLFGSIPVNRRLTVFIHVPDSPTWQGIPLLARFEIPDTAPYIVPMDMDHHRHGYSTTVDLGRLSSTIGTPPKATTVHILIGRPRGEQVEPLLSRTVIITIAIPGYADHHRGPADLSLHMTEGPRHLQHAPADLALLEGQVNEEELVGTRNLARQDGYWKMLQGLIRQRLQDDPGGRQVTALRRGPGIGFRLYANGEAQLIEVERSSGDLKLDQAALLAVVNAHPFPPFPAGTSDNFVDVHVEVPPRAH